MDTTAELDPSKSNPLNPNPSLLQTKIREEGELSSSSDGDENPISSATRPAGSVNQLAPPVPISLPPSNKATEGIQARKASSGASPTISVDFQTQTFVQPNSDKSFKKNQAPLKSVKSANPGWHAPSGANANLVISFSDDDTGSESEDQRSENPLKIKRNIFGMDGNQRMPPHLLAKSSKLQPTAGNVSKVMPKKLSLSRTFVPSTAKIKGGAQSKVAGSSSVDQGSRVRNFSTMSRKFVSQENGGQVSNNTKLWDLRQQIALRERELKLKAAQYNKESASVSGREYTAMNQGTDAGRKSNAIPNSSKVEVKEPDSKRLKVSGSYSTIVASDRRHELPSVNSSAPLKEQASDSSNLQYKDRADQSQKESPTRRTESNVKWKKQDDKEVNVSSENPPNGLRDGLNISHNHIQTDRSTVLVDPCASLNLTNPERNMNSNLLLKNTYSGEFNHPARNSGHKPPGSLLQTSTGEQHSMNCCERLEGMSNNRTNEPSLDNVCQAPLNNLSLWNYLGSLNDSHNSNIDMHSLVEMEDSLEKELEEAQEQRRICEIEERNALRAYRKAQRALVEANARCSELYHKRELYSAHFRSLILNDSSLLWSLKKPEHVEIGLKHTDIASRNLELMPPSTHPKRPEYSAPDQPCYDSNIQNASGVLLNIPYRHADGQNLGSEPCSEPDASTSEPMHCNSKGAATMVSSPSNDPNISADEDEETSPIDHATVLPNYKIQQREQDVGERQKDVNRHSNSNTSINGSADSLVLEATLRSELFARLGKRILSKNSGSANVDPADELVTENDNGSERTQTSNGSVLLSEVEKNQEFDFEGNDQSEREISGDPVEIHNGKTQGDESYANGRRLTTVEFLPASVLRSVFCHVKVIAPFTSSLQCRENKNVYPCDYNNETGSINPGEIQHGILKASPMEESVSAVCSKEIGSFTCNVAVDPFWPLCMYELRGKCNNDQCPWQHVRDISNEKVGQHPLDDSDSADFQGGMTLHQKKCQSARKLHNCQNVLTPPTYLVGLDILRADACSYGSFITQKNGQGWQKCFSICLALSNALQKDLPPDVPFSHSSDGRIEVHGSWGKQLSYFQSRNSKANHQNQMTPTNVQALEMAFSMLTQGVNKLGDMKKALSILSRAIEVDPKSEVLWITYLLIYYGIVKLVSEDDMFSHAVKHNDRSYGLWLMYINSRMCLDDRMVAYDAALKALCHHSSAHERDDMYVSACILDLFLQMMDCLCMSGNVEKAIQKISGLLHVGTNSDQHHSLLISDILACLTISDKCMFWVCCVYLVIYRKLPDAIVHKFEFDKEFLAIEWPNVHILDEDKQRAVKLVEIAVNSVKLSVGSESILSDINLRSVQYLGLCHIRCMVALYGLESSRSLLDEYKKLYPSSIEFALISARIQMTYFEDLSFEGFEEALRNCPKETPGIHCIWNQYIECALLKGDLDFAKELIARWFDSFPEVLYLEKEKSDAVGSGGSHGSLILALTSNPDLLAHNSIQMDTIFRYLNLSLGKLLQNDLIEARNAIDKALKAAGPLFFKHCLKEHAMFLLTYESVLKDAFFSEQLNVLKGYLDAAQTFPVCEPLSTRFINKIEKPRVQQLLGNILTPVPPDLSVVNLVLEVWYGPSLLPQKFGNTKELVDFVEAIFQMVPSNCRLAISVCSLLKRGEYFVDVTFRSCMLYWASSNLVDAIFHAIPIAPEYVWVEAANILDGIAGIELISERFYKRAITVYPFSVKLWNCYYNLSKTRGDVNSIVEAARGKGITLN